MLRCIAENVIDDKIQSNSITRTSFGRGKFTINICSSGYRGLIIAPGQEANGDKSVIYF